MRYSVIGATVQQVRDAGGVNVKETRSINIIFATLTSGQAARLRDMGCKVSKVEGIKTAVMPPPPVEAVPVYTPEQLTVVAGFEELRSLTDPPLYGSGFYLAIVDTGIREPHAKLAGRVVYSRNFSSDPMRDGFDHGTGVASVVVPIAPLCNILNIKVLGDNGEGTEEDAVMGIDHLITLHDEDSEYAPQVINLSFGTDDLGDPDDVLRSICRAAIERGIWVVAAAGNTGPYVNTVMSPACERYVAAVGSCGYEPFIVSDFSSRGPTEEGLPKPDALLFGENIILASSASDAASVAKSGTSFSTPFASALILLYLEGAYRQAVARQPLVELPDTEIYAVTEAELIDDYLLSLCVKPEGAPAGKDNDYGYGLPYGPLISQAIAAPALDISSIISLMITMMIVVMMMKSMQKAF